MAAVYVIITLATWQHLMLTIDIITLFLILTLTKMYKNLTTFNKQQIHTSLYFILYTHCTWDSRVSRKDDRMMKAALFDFIFTSDLKP